LPQGATQPASEKAAEKSGRKASRAVTGAGLVASLIGDLDSARAEQLWSCFSLAEKRMAIESLLEVKLGGGKLKA
jgi:hypothetical protein